MSEIVIGAVLSIVISAVVAVAQYALRSRPEDKIESYSGPRERQFQQGGSNYGTQIPIVLGRARLPGNLVWQSRVNEVEHKSSETVNQSNGKDDFQSTTTAYTYTYHCDFAVQICQGPITGIGKIWMDKQLVYSNVNSEPSIPFASGAFTVYYGTSSQVLPGSLPTSYRDTVIIFFENFNLTTFYNRMPVIEVEVLNNGDGVISQTVGIVTGAYIIEDICRRAGLGTDDFYISNIDSEFNGFVTTSGSLSDSLSMVVSASQAISIYSDDKIKFIGRANDVVVQIATGELRYTNSDEGEDNPLLLISREDAASLPSAVTVTCYDTDRDHDSTPQTSRISDPRFINEASITMPLGMTATQCARLSEIFLYSSWQERISYAFSLGPKYLYLEPGDVIQVEHDGQYITMMIRTIEYGANSVLKVSANSYSKGALQSTKTGAVFVTIKPENPPVTNTVFQYFNAPIITEDENKAGIWVFVNGDLPAYWYYTELYYSYDAVNFYFLKVLQGRGSFGSALTALADADPRLIDYQNTVDILINYGQLTSVAINDAIADPKVNLFFIGDELVQAATITLIAENTYRLSDLLRGRFGTEHYTDSHAIDEKIGAYSSANYVELNKDNDFNVPMYFKCVSNNQLLADVLSMDLVIPEFRTLKPYSPVNVDAVDVSGDILISWNRRSRYGTELPTTGAEVPLYEAAESYEIEILDDLDAVKRVLIATTGQVTYTAAQQTEDFGAAVTTLHCKVYQLSAIIGRGTPSLQLDKTL